MLPVIHSCVRSQKYLKIFGLEWINFQHLKNEHFVMSHWNKKFVTPPLNSFLQRVEQIRIFYP